jgi:MFS family permease
VQTSQDAVAVTNYFHALRLFSRNVRIFILSALLLGFAFFGIYAVLLNLYLLRLGYGPTVVGLVNGMGFVAYAVFSIPAGVLGARFGSREMLRVGFVLAALGMGLLPAAEFLDGNVQVVWIVATYTLTSMGLDAYFVNSNPFMIQFTTPRERMYLYSLRVGMSPIAAFVGALVGGFLPGTLAQLFSITDTASFALALLAAAVAVLIGVVALFNTEPTEAPVEEEDRARRSGISSSAFPLIIIAMLGLIIMLRIASEGAQRTFFNVYLDEILTMPTAQIGMLAAGGQLVGGLAALLAPFLTRRWSLEQVIVWATLGMALSTVAFAMIPHWAGAAVGYAGLVSFTYIQRPCSLRFTMEVVPARWRETAAGVANMVAGIGWGAMGFAGGFVVGAYGYQSFFLVSALLTGISALIFLWYFGVPGIGFSGRQRAKALN